MPHASWLVTEGDEVLAAREPTRRFASASMVKSFLLAAALERGLERVVVEPGMRADGDGVLRHFSLPVELAGGEALALMTVVSDNSATRAVIAALGGIDACNEHFAAWNLEATRLQRSIDGVARTTSDRYAMRPSAGLHTRAGLGVTTPVEHAWVLRRLVERGGLGLELLLAQQDRRSLARRLAEPVPFAHKTGTVGRARHDGGVLLAGGRAIFVQAFTDGGPEAEWVDHPACVGMGESMVATVRALDLDVEVLGT